MFIRIGSLVIAGVIGVVIGASAVFGCFPGGETHEEYYSHIFLETSRLGEMRGGNSITYVGDKRYCELVTESLGNSVTIRVPNAIPTYNLLTNPATIIECETRD